MIASLILLTVFAAYPNQGTIDLPAPIYMDTFSQRNCTLIFDNTISIVYCMSGFIGIDSTQQLMSNMPHAPQKTILL